MSIATCRSCGERWAASEAPHCPSCLARFWLNTPTLILEKHDPRGEPRVCDSYRSVLTREFLRDRPAFLEHAALYGTWYFDPVHDTYNHYTPEPLGRVPGFGIRAGESLPDHGLAGLLIADANREPHAFAVDPAITEERLAVGGYRSLELCRRPGCDNLVVPGASRCASHADPPLAD